MALLHERLHVVDPDPGLHGAAEAACGQTGESVCPPGGLDVPSPGPGLTLVLVELQAVHASLLSHAAAVRASLLAKLHLARLVSTGARGSFPPFFRLVDRHRETVDPEDGDGPLAADRRDRETNTGGVARLRLVYVWTEVTYATCASPFCSSSCFYKASVFSFLVVVVT